MSFPTRSVAIGAAAAALAWAASVGNAQPAANDDPVTKSRPQTAFPELKVPTKDRGGQAEPNGEAIVARLETMLADQKKRLPADAPPLRKVRVGQLVEGVGFIRQCAEVIRIGRFSDNDYMNFAETTPKVFRVGADVCDDPAEKVKWLEEGVVTAKWIEHSIETRARAGITAPQALFQARFHRLQAEADLLQLKEQLEKAGKK